MTSRGFRLWRDRVLHDDVWEHAKIRQWCKAIYQLAYYGDAAGHRSSVTEDEANQLVNMFEARYEDRFAGPLITHEQAEIGRNWLATKGVRFGLRRDIDWRTITHFRFVDVYTYEGSYRPYSTPVYAGFLPNGDVIRYHAVPWQTFEDFQFTLHEGANV